MVEGVEAFQRDFAGKITHWFTVSLPDVFTKTIPHWFDNAYQSFFRDVVNPISHAVDNVTHVFTKTIPHWFDSAAAAFSSDVVAPVRRFITGTVPGFFTRTVPHWWDSAAKFFSSDVVAPVRGFVTNAIPGFFTRTIPHWFDSARSAFSDGRSVPGAELHHRNYPRVLYPDDPALVRLGRACVQQQGRLPDYELLQEAPVGHRGCFPQRHQLDHREDKRAGRRDPRGPQITLSRAAACCPGTRPAGTACPRCCPPARASSSPRRSAGSAARRRSTRSTTPTPATGEPGQPGGGLAFAGGGIVPDIAGLGGDVLRGLKDAIAGGLRAAFDTAWKHAIAPTVAHIAGVGGMAGPLIALGASEVKTAIDKFLGAKDAKAAGGGGAGVPGPGGGAPAANAALARKMYPAWGSGAEWAAWNAVAMRESGW